MALRFQKKDDVDREVSERRRDPLWGIVIGGALYLSIRALLGWIGWGKGESLKSYGEDVVWLIAIGFLFWLVSPLYYEFRIRTKEIDGKVSAIEAAVNTHREGQRSETEPFNANKVMEKLAAIEERLNELSEKLENLHPGAGYAHSTSGIREGLRTIDARTFAMNANEREALKPDENCGQKEDAV